MLRILSSLAIMDALIAGVDMLLSIWIHQFFLRFSVTAKWDFAGTKRWMATQCPHKLLNDNKLYYPT